MHDRERVGRRVTRKGAAGRQCTRGGGGSGGGRGSGGGSGSGSGSRVRRARRSPLSPPHAAPLLQSTGAGCTHLLQSVRAERWQRRGLLPAPLHPPREAGGAVHAIVGGTNHLRKRSGGGGRRSERAAQPQPQPRPQPHPQPQHTGTSQTRTRRGYRSVSYEAQQASSAARCTVPRRSPHVARSTHQLAVFQPADCVSVLWCSQSASRTHQLAVLQPAGCVSVLWCSQSASRTHQLAVFQPACVGASGLRHRHLSCPPPPRWQRCRCLQQKAGFAGGGGGGGAGRAW
jgi:hypothetical protein